MAGHTQVHSQGWLTTEEAHGLAQPVTFQHVLLLIGRSVFPKMHMWKP
jgi:hypothetical protein